MMVLPEGVSFSRNVLGAGRWSYAFHHDGLGELGRVVLSDLPDGGHVHVSCEHAGTAAAERAAERRAMFEPLARELVERLEADLTCRSGNPADQSASAPVSPRKA